MTSTRFYAFQTKIVFIDPLTGANVVSDVDFDSSVDVNFTVDVVVDVNSTVDVEMMSVIDVLITCSLFKLK